MRNTFSISFLISALALIILASSCNKNGTSDKTTKTEQSKSEVLDYKALNDSVNTSWQVMILADDNKIADIKRLIEEISYTKKYNLFLLDSVRQMQQSLASKRYDQISMQKSSSIDQYDAATDSLVRAVFRLAKTTPNIDQYQTAMQLVQDINTAENEVVLFRVRYDSWVRTYNDYIQTHKTELEDKLKSGAVPEKYFLFTLNQ